MSYNDLRVFSVDDLRNEVERRGFVMFENKRVVMVAGKIEVDDIVNPANGMKQADTESRAVASMFRRMGLTFFCNRKEIQMVGTFILPKESVSVTP